MTPDGAAFARVQPARALSVRQPWAWAILFAGKRIENRSRNTNVRGDFLLHAAKGCTAKEYAAAARFMALRGLVRVAGITPKQTWLPGCDPPILPPLEELQRGGFVGVASLVDVVRPGDLEGGPWHEPKFYGWRLDNVEAIPFRKASGLLGFFSVNTAGEVTGRKDPA